MKIQNIGYVVLMLMLGFGCTQNCQFSNQTNVDVTIEQPDGGFLDGSFFEDDAGLACWPTDLL